ncbi:protein of unknown function [Stenotrophomonas maltophilia]|nr:protein of unknown function [Stenotrophomonas maltophilia]
MGRVLQLLVVTRRQQRLSGWFKPNSQNPFLQRGNTAVLAEICLEISHATQNQCCAVQDCQPPQPPRSG